ncbi:MAG: hypothetical protein M1824_000811 [Vezdaea acicularis]|nr:MAG: hypothetical protein M1824_000811 [Vezdaea acicularis]
MTSADSDEEARLHPSTMMLPNRIEDKEMSLKKEHDQPQIRNEVNHGARTPSLNWNPGVKPTIRTKLTSLKLGSSNSSVEVTASNQKAVPQPVTLTQMISSGDHPHNSKDDTKDDSEGSSGHRAPISAQVTHSYGHSVGPSADLGDGALPTKSEQEFNESIVGSASPSIHIGGSEEASDDALVTTFSKSDLRRSADIKSQAEQPGALLSSIPMNRASESQESGEYLEGSEERTASQELSGAQESFRQDTISKEVSRLQETEGNSLADAGMMTCKYLPHDELVLQKRYFGYEKPADYNWNDEPVICRACYQVGHTYEQCEPNCEACDLFKQQEGRFPEVTIDATDVTVLDMTRKIVQQSSLSLSVKSHVTDALRRATWKINARHFGILTFLHRSTKSDVFSLCRSTAIGAVRAVIRALNVQTSARVGNLQLAQPSRGEISSTTWIQIQKTKQFIHREYAITTKLKWYLCRHGQSRGGSSTSNQMVKKRSKVLFAQRSLVQARPAHARTFALPSWKIDLPTPVIGLLTMMSTNVLNRARIRAAIADNIETTGETDETIARTVVTVRGVIPVTIMTCTTLVITLCGMRHTSKTPIKLTVDDLALVLAHHVAFAHLSQGTVADKAGVGMISRHEVGVIVTAREKGSPHFHESRYRHDQGVIPNLSEVHVVVLEAVGEVDAAVEVKEEVAGNVGVVVVGEEVAESLTSRCQVQALRRGANTGLKPLFYEGR